jgi:hypothetical protein
VSDTVKQLCSVPGFQGGDRRTDRRLREIERLAGRCHMLSFRNGDENPELLQCHEEYNGIEMCFCLHGVRLEVARDCAADEAGRNGQVSMPGTVQRARGDDNPECGQTDDETSPDGGYEPKMRLAAERQSRDRVDAQRKGEAPPADVERHPSRR